MKRGNIKCSDTTNPSTDFVQWRGLSSICAFFVETSGGYAIFAMRAAKGAIFQNAMPKDAKGASV